MTERFSKQEFEQSLPETSNWQYAGFISGEHCYYVPVTKTTARILIRSSVGDSGYASGNGENSIRLWIVDENGDMIGSKLTRWITRQPGWRDRLIDQLRTMWRIARKLGTCEKCGTQRKAFRVKKDGVNKGRIFMKCPTCDTFEWID